MLSSVFDSVHFSQIHTTQNDPRPQMIPKIDLNKTPNTTQIFSHVTCNEPEELKEWKGKHFYLGDKFKAF